MLTSSDITIKQLEDKSRLPYHLLLLADPSEAAIDKYIHDADVYIAMLGDALIGLYVLYALSDEVVEIKNIAIDEGHQRQGIGKLLLKDAVERAKAKAYKRLIVGTGNSSLGELAFYQKNGFELFDVKWNFFTDNYTEPIFEDGIQCKHMMMLEQKL